MSDILVTLRRRVAQATEAPGIYRWKNAAGDILYVGKAKNLRNRLRSYVRKDADKGLGPWKLSMIQQLADFDVTVVNSELEALVLETNLIKKLRPKYNILMKDGKNYVYVRLAMKDPFPWVDVVRKMEDDGARYFGPFISAFETRKSLDMLHELFNWRACKASIDALNKMGGHVEAMIAEGKVRPCLDYQIGQCCGTCAGVVTQEEYRSRIDKVIDFFKGNYKPVIDNAHSLMLKAASERRFEKATQLRDLLRIIEHMQEKQIVSDTSGENVDVIGLALLSGKVQVVIMNKREGKLIGEQQFNLMGGAESIAEVLEQFLPQYYESILDIPDAVILGEDFPGRDVVEEFLTKRRGKKVKVIIPERGNKTRLLELAETNAQEKAKQAEATWEADQRNTERALEELVSLLDLPGIPDRIEGYDISHSAGTETVGSMVVCINGKPRNDHYRSFTIHSMQRGVIDDYRSLKEVLTRRLRHAAGGIAFEEEQWEKKAGVTFGRARKEEASVLTDILSRQPETTPSTAIDHKQFVVARHESEVIGFVRLQDEKDACELTSLWCDDAYGDRQLAQFLARKILRSCKKGKVYALVPTQVEQQYASLGFRHVIKPPKAFQDRLSSADNSQVMLMMYETAQHKPDVSLSTLPNLLVIDGGKGQLNTVVEVLKEFSLDIPVIGLAKREEEVFVPGKPVSVLFPSDSPAKFLLMRLRDEAHRFANRHREKRVLKTSLTSRLDSIPGIGPEMKQKLLTEFGSVESIRSQPDEVLERLLSEEQIARVREFL